MSEVSRGTTIQCPIEIGGVYWIATPTNEKVTLPCPVCAGNQTIDVILGSGERVTVECEGCGIGLDGPRGTVQEYRLEPAVKQVVVDRVSRMPVTPTDKWSFYLVGEGYADENELFETETEAWAAALMKRAQQDERNMRAMQTTRGHAGKSGWSVRFHRKKIADLTRQIVWHQNKVIAAKAES